MNSWHTVRVRYTKQFTDGTLKRVSEPYLVNSISFTDAEARIHQEIGEFVRGEFQVTHVSKTDFCDIFNYDDSEVWYKCKVTYVSEDVDSGKEKKINNNFLVSAHNVKEAYERIEESLKGLMVSYEISKVETTKILEIFPYVAMEGEELVTEDEYQEEGESDGVKVEYTEDKPTTELKEFAKTLNNCNYRNELTKEQEDVAEARGYVVVFGASDDLIEFRGAIGEEFGAWEGGNHYFDRDGDEKQEDEHSSEELNSFNIIESIWCPTNENEEITSSWAYKTEIPHESFNVLEDGELYCVGIVFKKSDLK